MGAIMRQVLVWMALMLALAGPAQAKDPFALAVHGNWCGPGALSGPVTDVLDAACKRHDLCARREGMFNCGCDLAFMRELRETRWPKPLYRKARAIYEAIAMIPCHDAEGQRTKMDWMLNDWRGAVARGREPADARLERFFWLLGLALSDKP